MRATTIDTGEEVWSKPAADKLCGTARGCSCGAGRGADRDSRHRLLRIDGRRRARLLSDDGSIVWQFDTNKEFETVNGVTANGGAIDGPGPVVADGMVYVMSGYVSLIGRPGNVLLAFGVTRRRSKGKKQRSKARSLGTRSRSSPTAHGLGARD